MQERYPLIESKPYQRFTRRIKAGLVGNNDRWWILFLWAFIHQIGKLAKSQDIEGQSMSWLEEWQFLKITRKALSELGLPEKKVEESILQLKVAIQFQNWSQSQKGKTLATSFENWLSNPEIRQYLQVNRYNDVLWFNKEQFQDFVWWLLVLAILKVGVDPSFSANEIIERSLELEKIAQRMRKAERRSGYQLTELLANLKN